MKHVGLVVLMGFCAGFQGCCNYNDSIEPPGDISNFNPTASFPEIQAYAGEDAKLREIKARYVRSDGTMDLEAEYKPSLQYIFVRKSHQDNDKPLGTGTKNRAYEEVEVTVSKPGWVHRSSVGGGGINSESTERNKGMYQEISFTRERDYRETTRAPKCSFAKIWKKARKLETIDKSAVAVITYDYLGYEFVINDLKVRLFFDKDCKPESAKVRRMHKRGEKPANVDELRKERDEMRKKRDARRKAKRKAREQKAQKRTQ